MPGIIRRPIPEFIGRPKQGFTVKQLNAVPEDVQVGPAPRTAGGASAAPGAPRAHAPCTA